MTSYVSNTGSRWSGIAGITVIFLRTDVRKGMEMNGYPAPWNPKAHAKSQGKLGLADLEDL
jgi:hypothetical protein